MNTKPTKTRNWFITINQNAECFHSAKDLVQQIEKCQFSMILHDKDNEEQPHYHICLLYENARSFEQVSKYFLGAHIEIMESKYMCFRYLLHMDDKDKFQYDLNEVLQRGNNVEYYSTHDEYIKLDTESVLENIANGSIHTIYDAVKIFGIKQCNVYKNIIKELIDSTQIERTAPTEKEFQLLKSKIDDLEMSNMKYLTDNFNLEIELQQLQRINSKLMLQVKEYEKLVNERGLL